MLYSILFTLRIRLLSPEFFSSAPGKDLCEGLLTERFTTTRNLTCEREQMFLAIFTSTLVIQCLSHSAGKLSFVKFILSQNHGGEIFVMRTLNPNSSVILIQMSLLKTQNQTRMKIMTMRKIRVMRNNKHHCQYNKNRL